VRFLVCEQPVSYVRKLSAIPKSDEPNIVISSCQLQLPLVQPTYPISVSPCAKHRNASPLRLRTAWAPSLSALTAVFCLPVTPANCSATPTPNNARSISSCHWPPLTDRCFILPWSRAQKGFPVTSLAFSVSWRLAESGLYTWGSRSRRLS